VNDLVDQLGISQPLVSKHLRILREAGLVDVRVEAQRRFYRLRPGPLAEIDSWIQPYRRFLHSRFDLLERHLDEMPDEPPATPGDDPE
jgi:DNA-binding transcriptional ArsR family regulator